MHCPTAVQSLQLLDYLLKNGSERVIDDAHDNLHTIRTLDRFRHQEDGGDVGINGRQESTACRPARL